MGLFDIFKRKKKDEIEAEVEQVDVEEQGQEEEAAAEVDELVSQVVEQVESDIEDDEDEITFATEFDTEFEEMEIVNTVEVESEAIVETDEQVEAVAEQADVIPEPVDVEPEAETEAEVESEQATEQEEVKEKKGLFGRLFSGLSKTRDNITDKIDRLLNTYGEIDDDLFEELEEILITADIGMDTTMELIDDLRSELNKRKINDVDKVKPVLTEIMTAYLTPEEQVALVPKKPTVILVIGVNGAGKTTSIGKIANLLKSEGNSVLLAAADTFRAAAIDQLKVWGERVDVNVIAHSEGSDPAAVVFDACQAAKARKSDVLIVDTAGRLHNKVNLMKELNKIFRTIEREFTDAHLEVLLVLDATTGQNAVQQAKLFKESAPITGLVLTKLDGTAKGGFIFAIRHILDIPLKLIGVGEKIDDLQHFNPEEFAKAIME